MSDFTATVILVLCFYPLLPIIAGVMANEAKAKKNIVIGVTLPFFSAGGSSVVMMYLCIGIVLSVGMNTRRSKLDMQRII